MATFTGTAGQDIRTDTAEAGGDVFNLLDGNDIVLLDNLGLGGPDQLELGNGDDVILTNNTATQQVRLSFVSAAVGNGSNVDSGFDPGEDGNLGVRIQLENADGTLFGGSGTSRSDDEGVTFYARQAGATFDVRDSLAATAVSRGNFRAVTLGSSAADILFAQDFDTYINGGLGNDTINGLAANDFLDGGAGDDALTGNEGADRFIGGLGNDIIRGGVGNDEVVEFNVATGGADNVDLGAGNDIVRINSGASTLPGTPSQRVNIRFTSAEVGNGSANDSTTGAIANQDGGLAARVQLEGAGGTLTGPVSRFDDEGTIFFATGNTTLSVTDLPSGVGRGNGSDFQVVQLGVLAGEFIDVTTSGLRYYINAGGGNDVVLGGTVEDTLVGGAGNDDIRGFGGNDELLGGGGTDTLVGGDGNDVQDGGDNAAGTLDLLFGEAGDDFLFGRTGDDQLAGGAGADFLFGEEGADQMFGEDGVDRLEGGAGNDFGSGGLGSDGLFGGAGNDNLNGDEDGDFILGGDDDDTLNGGLGADLLGGENGVDRLNGDDGDDVAYGGAGNDVVFGGEGADRISGDDADVVSGSGSTAVISAGVLTGNDFLLGGNGNDVVLGGLGDDLVGGEAGSDNVDGGAGRDFVFGGSGIDKVSGGDGDDFLDGQEDGDAVFGGEGADVATGGDGNDQVLGDGGNDQVRGGAGDDFVFGGDGGDIVAGDEIPLFNPDGTLIRGGVVAATGGQDELNGNAGADLLYGGIGADRLTGGADADIFLFRSTAESNGFGPGPSTTRDVITDFVTGVDKIDLIDIDANVSLGGDQAFTFAGVVTGNVGDGFPPGVDATNIAGRLEVRVIDGQGVFLYGYTNNGDLNPDLVIAIGSINIAATDFFL